MFCMTYCCKYFWFIPFFLDFSWSVSVSVPLSESCRATILSPKLWSSAQPSSALILMALRRYRFSAQDP